MTANDDILVLVETEDGKPASSALELLALARGLAADRRGNVSAVIVEDSQSDCIPLLFAHGADQVFVASDEGAGDRYRSDVWLTAATEVLSRVCPHCILLGHTDLGAEVGPRLAFRLKASIATGCERVDRQGGKLVITRPCFGNKAREVLTLHTEPAVTTVRARAIEPLLPDPSRRGEVVRIALPTNKDDYSVKVLERRQDEASEGVRLEMAKVVVAGGRGLGGPEGFKLLQQLASVLGGAVGASRVACDLEWCPRSWQIGLSGKTVAPDLYIAVGISGAGQHMAGCGKARAILAINSDPEAAIFKDASFGVIGDYKQIIPPLMEEISRHKARDAA